MAGTRDETTTMTTTLEEQRVHEDEWHKLYDGDDDNDVFVDAFTSDVSCMLSDVARSAFHCSLHLTIVLELIDYAIIPPAVGYFPSNSKLREQRYRL